MSWKILREELWLENYEFWIRHNPAHIPQRESFRVQRYNFFVKYAREIDGWGNFSIRRGAIYTENDI